MVWRLLYRFLFATTRDGFTITPSTGKLCDPNAPVDQLKGTTCYSSTISRAMHTSM